MRELDILVIGTLKDTTIFTKYSIYVISYTISHRYTPMAYELYTNHTDSLTWKLKQIKIT